MSDFTCTKCGAALQEDDFNLELGVARCGFCRAWTRIGEPQPRNAESVETRLKKETNKPDTYEVHEYQGVLHITWRWFSWGVLFLIPFCLLWNGFLVFWYSMALGMDADGIEILALLFPIIHVAVGVGLTYFTIAAIFNRTTIMVGGHHMSIKHGPIPWKGTELNDTDDIDQLYCEEKMHRGKNSTSYTYEVKAKLHSGGEVKLLTGLQEIQEALYLEQKIEEFLGIEDRRVAGEVSP
ncbi:MAG: hypothetical protein KDA65_17600 [Planctomycetaceae bacterium]|nr:hypothetical protein [Planctomycetaceae bacterium]